MISNKKNNNNITTSKQNLSANITDNTIKKNSSTTTATTAVAATTTTSLSYQLFKNRRFNKLNNRKLLEPVANTELSKLDGDDAHSSSMATPPSVTADDVSSSSSTTVMKAMNKPPDCLGNVLDKVKALKRIDDNKFNDRFRNSLYLGIDTEEISILNSNQAYMKKSIDDAEKLLKSKEIDPSTIKYRPKSILHSPSSMMPTLKPILSSSHEEKMKNNSKINENLRRSKFPDPSQLHDPHLESLKGEMMAISQDDADKYFGEESRIIFFEQYRKMCNATMHIATNISSIVDEDDIDSCDDIEDQSSIMSKGNDSLGAGSSISNISTIMNSLSTEFYTQLQSSVSKEKVNLEIDKELLSYNSFKLYQGRPFVKKAFHLEPIEKKDNNINNNDNSYNSYNSSISNNNISINKSRSPKTKVDRSYYSKNNQKSVSHIISIPAVVDNDAGSIGDLTMNTSTELLSTVVLASPRTKYISGCIRENLFPMPNLIIRKRYSTTLNLNHYGFGDKMGCVLAECLKDLPHIEAINLADNNLTDDSLKYLIQAIMCIPSLQDLNLSRNKIDGESSDALAEYVSDPDCPLITLTLQSADVDDGEADRFIQCLISNGKLLELDLSSNMLGTAEVASIGDASIKTGGASIAEFIVSKHCRLEVLKLAWNSIRLNSAIKLSQAIAFNSTITFLDLGNNGMGWEAGEMLGDAIMENRTLKTLLVPGNSFTSTACLSICIGVIENLAMKHMSLNENPIGVDGAKMIMQTSMVLGSRVLLTAANCNTVTIDEKCWYKPAQLLREYELQLDKPFDRAVAFHVLHTIASHSTLVLDNVTYNGNTLRLVQAISHDRELFFDDEQKNIVNGLRLLQEAASNVELGTKLFYEADEDNSGRLDRDELKNVLDKIGFIVDDDKLNDLLAVFDVDGAGTIDLNEFLSLLKSQNREATIRIKEMVEYPIMALNSDRTKRYIPPKTGILKFNVVDGYVRKRKFYTVTYLDQKYAQIMAKSIGDLLLITDAVGNSKLRMDEAYRLYQTLYKELGDTAECLAQILPMMMSPTEARQLVSKTTHDERLKLNRVKAKLGVTLRPMYGAFNGYYCLDLKKELHRICFSRLLEQSQTSNARRAAQSIIGHGRVGDLSQHGNWTSFRNAHLDGKPIIIIVSDFNPIPHKGILEFDFSDINRPDGTELKMTDKRLCKVLSNICLLDSEKTIDALNQMDIWKHRANMKSKDGSIFMPIYEFPIQKALEYGFAADKFYDSLLNRVIENRIGERKEDLKIVYMGKDDEDLSIAESSNDDDQSSVNRIDIDDDHSQNSVDDNTHDKEDNVSIAPSEDSSTVAASEGSNRKLALRQLRIRELKDRMSQLLNQTTGITIHAKASRFVEVIEESFQQLWILTRHLAFIVKQFQSLFGDCSKTKSFGSYQVDIIVYLFPRIVDIHNFELIFELLSAYDCACVINRIGILYIFNPLKPEITIELDMSRREDRVVAKMIVFLSVDEPGLNLTYKRFQWKRDIDPIPGWDVTEPWMTEDGMPKHGKFAFTYYSGEGKNLSGCIPNVRLRKVFTVLTLVNENEIINEDDLLPEDYICSAEKHFEHHRTTWDEFLVPGCGDAPKRKTVPMIV